jgi:hypothetical protein
MKVGILEESSDEFANHVLIGIKDLGAEFVSVKELGVAEDSNYKVIFDRVSYLNPFLRETMKKFSLAGTRVINNPFAAMGTNKIIDGVICRKLRIPTPKTIVLPMIDDYHLENVKEPDIDKVIADLELPLMLKPFDGFAWDNVYKVNSVSDFKNLYSSLKTKFVMIAQEFIYPRSYYRIYTIGKKEVLFVKYEPKPAGMGQYIYSDLKDIEGILEKLTRWNIRINKALDLDFNAIEWCIDEGGKPFVIDAFNETPEIIKGMMPNEYYDWIVGNICQLIRDNVDSDRPNKTIFKF